jgi:hypothetical protein
MAQPSDIIYQDEQCSVTPRFINVRGGSYPVAQLAGVRTTIAPVPKALGCGCGGLLFTGGAGMLILVLFGMSSRGYSDDLGFFAAMCLAPTIGGAAWLYSIGKRPDDWYWVSITTGGVEHRIVAYTTSDAAGRVAGAIQQALVTSRG